MTLSNYAYNKKMTLAQYELLESNINNASDAIIQNIKNLHPTDTGIYYPVNEIIKVNADNSNSDLVPYIIQSLKSKGVEFYDNNTLYRY